MMNLREMAKVLRSPKVPVKPSTFLAAMANLKAPKVGAAVTMVVTNTTIVS